MEVYDKITNEFKTISLEEMNKQLEKDMVDSGIIIKENEFE